MQHVVPGGHGPLGVGPGGRLGGGGLITTQPWEGVTGDELPFAGQSGTYCHWYHGVDFPDCLEGEYGQWPPWCCISAHVAETRGRLEHCMCMLEQEVCGLEEPAAFDYEVKWRMIARNTETTSPHLAVRTVTQQKVKREQPAVQGGIPPGPPMWLSSWHIDHILR